MNPKLGAVYELEEVEFVFFETKVRPLLVDRPALLRRLCFDLLGLPPTLER